MTPVEFLFLTPDGVPIANALVEIQLSRASFDNEDTGVIMPRLVEARTDENGEVTVNLQPLSVSYYATVEDPASDAVVYYEFLVPEIQEPVRSVRLQDIVIVGPISDKPYDEVALALIQDAKVHTMASMVEAREAAELARQSIKTVTDAQAATEADAASALASKAAAAASAQAAAVSQLAALTSEDIAENAQLAAEAARNTAIAQATVANNKAGEAAASATAANTSKVAAETAKTAAETARTTATTAATTATDKATIATTKAGEAATSATTASTKASEAAASAVAAKASEDKAKTSETNAAGSATTATTKAGEAITSATNAATSKTGADTAKTAAEAARDAATTARNAAQTAETNAKASETKAKTSETNSKTSETAAGLSATAANTSKVAAATSETNAYNSSIAAGQSQTAAGTKASEASVSAQSALDSKNAAATSASNAAGSATAAAQSNADAQTAKTAAETARATAITKAVEADASAGAAALSAANALTEANRSKTEADRAQSLADQVATGQVKANWAETDPASKAFIDNKPNIEQMIADNALPSGTATQYVRGDKTLADFPSAVRATPLTGISTGSTASVTASDTPVTAAGKLQAQMNARAPLASPTFTGTPRTTVPAAGTNTTQIAPTSWVLTEIASAINQLVSSAPGTLDTLNELAIALGNDPNFATTMTNSLAGKANLNGDSAVDFNARSLQMHNGGAVVMRDATGNIEGRVLASGGAMYVQGGQGTTDATGIVVVNRLGTVDGELARVDVLTSNATIKSTSASDTSLNIDGDGMYNRALNFKTAGGMRWQVASNDDGSSNFVVRGWSQEGVMSEALKIIRGPNHATFGGNVAAAGNITASGGTLTAGGVNIINISGGASGVAPSLITAGSNGDIGMYFGAKGGGRFDFFNASGRHLQVGGYTAATSVVNFARIYGGPVGGNFTFTAEGSDTNIGIDFTAKNAGEMVYRGNNSIQFKVRSVGTAVNYATVYGAVANGRPTIEAQGSDADIGLALNGKGVSDVMLATGGRAIFKAEGVANAVNYISTNSSASGTSPRFTATGSDANVNMLLSFKGSGGLYVDGYMNLRGANGSTERRVVFNNTNNTTYFYARDSDGAIGLYDLQGGTAPWFYTPATKVLSLGEGTSKVTIGRDQVTNLDTLSGNRFFGFGLNTVGAPAAFGTTGYDAVGLQLDQSGQRTQLALAGDKDGMFIRTDDTPDGTNGWGAWKQMWDSGNLTQLSQLTNDLVLKGNRLGFVDLGDSAATTTNISFALSNYFRLRITGASPLVLQNIHQTDGGFILLELVNGAAFPFTWSTTINWMKSDGSGDTVTNFNQAGYTLKTAGTDWVLLWCRNNSVYGKVAR